MHLFQDDQLVSLGTIVDRHGHILTKASNVNGQVQCRFWDGQKQAAEPVGADTAHDLALLRVARQDISPADFDQQARLTMGMLLATPGGFGDKPLAIGVSAWHPDESPTRRCWESELVRQKTGHWSPPCFPTAPQPGQVCWPAM